MFHAPSRTGRGSSRAGLALSLGGSALAVVRAIRQARRAKGGHGTSGKADVLAGAMPIVASAVMAVRQLRRSSRQA